MEFYTWNPLKNEQLKKERGICFEDIVLRIHLGNVLGIVENPNYKKYPNQMIMLIDVDGYVYLVPFIIREDGIFLKTIYPSRKFTKKYLDGE